MVLDQWLSFSFFQLVKCLSNPIRILKFSYFILVLILLNILFRFLKFEYKLLLVHVIKILYCVSLFFFLF